MKRARVELHSVAHRFGGLLDLRLRLMLPQQSSGSDEVITEPPTTSASLNPMMVIRGNRAFRKTCRPITTLSDSPLARPVLT